MRPSPANATAANVRIRTTAILAEASLPSKQGITPWLVVVLAVVLFSGGLFGYDQGIISGELHGIKTTFWLGPLVEVVTRWVSLGALSGALAAALRAAHDRTPPIVEAALRDDATNPLVAATLRIVIDVSSARVHRQGPLRQLAECGAAACRHGQRRTSRGGDIRHRAGGTARNRRQIK